MPEYELIQQRSISGKGVLKVPSDVRKNRAYILYASVFRQPQNKYINKNYNPPRSRYGTLTFLRNNYVIFDAPIEYERQVFDGVNDISGQTLFAIKCAYEGLLDTFFNLSIALSQTPGGLGLEPIAKMNGIKDYENLRLAWDECKLQCYADTAIELSLYRLVYDICNEDMNKDREPPPPPPPPPPIPPGTSIEGIDEAYDDDTDNGDTIPYPGDVPYAPVLNGTWMLTWDTSSGASASGTYFGVSTDTWSIVGGISPTCQLSGNSVLFRNYSEIIDTQFNCNHDGFVSTLILQEFIPNP